MYSLNDQPHEAWYSLSVDWQNPETVVGRVYVRIMLKKTWKDNVFFMLIRTHQIRTCVTIFGSKSKPNKVIFFFTTFHHSHYEVIKNTLWTTKRTFSIKLSLSIISKHSWVSNNLLPIECLTNFNGLLFTECSELRTRYFAASVFW